MPENNILVPVDYSPASKKAIEFGLHIAQKMNGSITLFHAYQDESKSLDECNAELKRFARPQESIAKVGMDYHCERGDIFTTIPRVAAKKKFNMVVIVTHGRKGIRQKLFGADIVKLLKLIPKPTLVIQEHSPIFAKGFSQAIFPVGGHEEYEKKIEAMIQIAGLFDTEVRLYSISRAGSGYSDKLRANIKLAEERFLGKGIRFARIEEDQKVFSVGFSKQTLEYAYASGADLIAIMANPTRENYYFADTDKEAILTNEKGIAVLSVSSANGDV